MTAVLERSSGRRRLPRPGPRLRRSAIGVGVTLGLLLWVLAAGMGGAKGAAVASVLSVAVAITAILSSGLSSWLMNDSVSGDVVPHGHGVFLRDLADRATRTKTRELITATVLLGVTVAVATGTALIGDKALLLLVMTVALVSIILAVRNRSLMFMFVLAASFSLIWYKKFTPFLSESYAVAIYITTIDVVLLFAYGVWAAEGTLYQDLRRGLRNPVFMLPFAGIAVALLSAVNAVDQRLVWAEIVRYGWMTALFVYCGIRVRRREHIWAFMLGWLVFLSVQVIVATSQYFTHGFLGIEQFQLKPDPFQPISDQLVRPFGTQIHPAFLACVVGMICLMVACFSLHVPKGNIVRYALLSCVPLSVAIAVASRARGPLVALAPAIVLVLFFAVRRHLLSIRVIIVAGLVGLLGAAAAAPQVTDLAKGMFSTNAADSNLMANWNGRWQINLIAFRMVRDHPFVGTGINSFESQIKNYKYEENKFDFRPAHNLYILMAAENGILGLGFTLLIGSVFAMYAYRLTLFEDRFYQSIGIGALGILAFIAVEEINSFSLKEDVPMAMFWAVFGLIVAATRMAKEGAPELPVVHWFRPNADPDRGEPSTTEVSTTDGTIPPASHPDIPAWVR